MVLIRNIGYRTLPKIWVGIDLSCAERTSLGENVDLILTVKWKVDIPYIEGQFGSEFPAICNHCGMEQAAGVCHGVFFRRHDCSRKDWMIGAWMWNYKLCLHPLPVTSYKLQVMVA